MDFSEWFAEEFAARCKAADRVKTPPTSVVKDALGNMRVVIKITIEDAEFLRSVCINPLCMG